MSDNLNDELGRRRFMAQAGGACLTGGAALGTFFNVQMMGQLAAAELPEGDDYRALVCVFLQGGNDSFNMLTPRGPAEFQEYAEIRRNLSVSRDSLLPIETPGVAGKELGMHGAMPKLKALYDAEKLGFLANVGSLQQRISKVDFEISHSLLPDGLFSHSDQQQQWHTSLPDRSASSGWLGRLTDTVEDLNGVGNFASSISVQGINLSQTGNTTIPYAIGPSGSVGLSGWNNPNWAKGQLAVTSQLDLEYANLLQKTFLGRKKRAIELNELFRGVLADIPDEGVGAEGGTLAEQLQMVQRVIQAREELGVRRQTFFVMLGGWDLHTSLLNPHEALLRQLDEALSGFQSQLDAAGLTDEVTTFTVSDFGRSLTSNGQGSDHGWGGNQLVMGGAVKGGDVYGEYPDLYEGNPLDVGRGRLIPTTSVDEYFTELACWFGIPQSRILEILPNLNRFYDVSGGLSPIGFMKGLQE